jgi:hypothetical protein
MVTEIDLLLQILSEQKRIRSDVKRIHRCFNDISKHFMDYYSIGAAIYIEIFHTSFHLLNSAGVVQ